MTLQDPANRPLIRRKGKKLLEHFERNPASSLRKAANEVESLAYDYSQCDKTRCEDVSLQDLCSLAAAAFWAFRAESYHVWDVIGNHWKPNFLHNVIFSDKSTFWLDGTANRDNFGQIWKPKEHIEKSHSSP